MNLNFKIINDGSLMVEEPSGLMEELLAPHQTEHPLQHLLRSELLQVLHQAMDAFEDPLWGVFQLITYEGLSEEEVAARMGLSLRDVNE